MRKIIFVFFLVNIISFSTKAQVNAVQFGKNRIQYKKFKWQFFQAEHFNVYFSQHGLELAKYIAQVAEEELPNVEQFTEYSLQRKANIIIYNQFNDFQSSNIGMDIDWQNNDGLTKLVNNKIIIYFDGNHAHLKRQIREGIARTLVDNMLLGSNFSEVATNQAFLDLPSWLINGYIAYAAEPWSAEKDDALKSAMLSGDYSNFYALTTHKPLLAGQAFWYYIAEKYGQKNVTYLLYLSRIYKSLNKAVQQVCKKKLKLVLQDFISYEQTKYYDDIRKRKIVPKGRLSVTEEVNENKDYFRFQANPNPRSFTYAVVEYKSGLYKVILNENYINTRVLLHTGVRMMQNKANPNYPILAWDPKGTRLLVIYTDKADVKMFIYDVARHYKYAEQTITAFDQILDAQFMLNENTLVLSAVKNGHTDVFTYKIDKQQVEQITNDVYDDLDPSFVAFPNKTGIIFSSNRPTATASNADTALPGRKKYNVFLVDITAKGDYKQITQLTNMKHGDARYPSQYNNQHFTFVSDESGIGNRYAGYFTTQRNGVDTLVMVGDEVLRNPSPKDLDSTLRNWNKTQPDSIDYITLTKDSTYTFPLTNYQSSLLESRIAGDLGQLSEVTRQGNYKFLYKLKLDTATLRKRNVTARPTAYMKKIMQDEKLKEGKATIYNNIDTSSKNIFQTPFENDTTPSRVKPIHDQVTKYSILENIKLFNYKLKFSLDQVTAGITNSVLINRFQPYGYGYGPIFLNNNNGINWAFSSSISDLFEDYKIYGAARFGSNFVNNEYLIGFQNYRKRLDWGVLLYRGANNTLNVYDVNSPYYFLQQKVITSLYQVNAAYPFDPIRSVRINLGYRNDRDIVKPIDYNGNIQPIGLNKADTNIHYIVAHLEYVHDNSIALAQNIWSGLRFKIYGDLNTNISKGAKDANTYNIGFDARYYYKIYRNFIWAVRAAADMSFGSRKIIYYLGGMDGWINPKFNNIPQPNPKEQYTFQTLAVNVRGFNQNVANGSRAFVMNSEFRFPIFSSLSNTPVKSPLLSNLQLIQFFDIGTAWEGGFENIKRPTFTSTTGPITVFTKTGGIGPFVGGYGFGLRTSLLGYFVKIDRGWPMDSFFGRKGIWYFGLGVDF